MSTETKSTGFLNRKKDGVYWATAYATGTMYLILALALFWAYAEHISAAA